MGTASEPALPQLGTLTAFSLADGVGRVRLDDGTELKIASRVLVESGPVVGARLRVLEAAPHVLGGFKAMKVEAIEPVAAPKPPAAPQTVPKGSLSAAEVEARRAKHLAFVRSSRQKTLETARRGAADPRGAWDARLVEAKIGEDSRQRVLESLRPAARVIATEDPHAEDRATYLGGSPLLAPGTSWPEHEEAPLAFLGQVRLREIPANVRASLHLPADGLLAFFYDATEQPWGFDPKDRGAGQVLWTSDPEAAVLHAPPASSSNELSPAKRVEVRETAMPPTESVWSDDLRVRPEDLKPYLAVSEEFHMNEAFHCLGGHAGAVQNGMELECALLAQGISTGGSVDKTTDAYARAKLDARSWRLLAQFDSDELLEWSWGDAGRLYFWMHEADLRAQRYERCLCILQSH